MTNSNLSAASEKLLKIAITALTADARGGEPIDESRIRTTVEDYAPIAGRELARDDIEAVIDEITKRLNVWTGKGGVLVGLDAGHKAWLAPRRGEINWKFWNRYRQFLEGSLPLAVLNEMDERTDQVLDLLEDPERSGSWRRQGLVVGHVQSGKTGNYTALICKAADAGYKVIVILSGIHNSLRAQTQIRLDEGFLGYAKEFGNEEGGKVAVGVGLIDGTVLANTVTTRDERGDFNKVKAKAFSIHAGGNVLLFVVKKNGTVLRNLIEWAKLSAKKPMANGGRVVGDIPLLIIDDEADQASIDTKVSPIDEATGLPDPDHNPSTINHLIRRLLETFEKRAYVGYTATPFANVFIHPDASTAEGGDDLFPKHFIVNLSAPSDYFGPARIFGRTDEELPPIGSVPSRLRFVEDASEWVPPSHKNTLAPRYKGQNRLPPSLEEAVRAFILSCAGRRARGDENAHKSMLVHVTRFTAVQAQVHQQISQMIEDLRTRWRARETTYSDPLAALMERQWLNDFARTSEEHGDPTIPWAAVEPHIWPVLDLVRVNLVNAKASDALQYEEHKKAGLHVIAVGGDKLSRGLTLEGLSVSYFLRAARMYDTLMQMGRWFGYRPGYEDLCRLYLSKELAEWYGHITDAAEELRREFDEMVLRGGTPDDYGLRVRTHPVLAITGKLRPGTPTITTSLSATAFEPTVLYARTSVAEQNWTATAEFTGASLLTEVHEEAEGDEGRQVMRKNVPGDQVLAYLRRLKFADERLTKTSGRAVMDYIAGRIAHEELKSWTVVVMGKKPTTKRAEHEPEAVLVRIGDTVLSTIYRHRVVTEAENNADFYTVKRLGSPDDEQLDLDAHQRARVMAISAARKADPTRDEALSRGPSIRRERDPVNGLLIIYMLTPPVNEDGMQGTVPLIGPYISFPHSPGAKPITYKLNWRCWDSELAGVE